MSGIRRNVRPVSSDYSGIRQLGSWKESYGLATRKLRKFNHRFPVIFDLHRNCRVVWLTRLRTIHPTERAILYRTKVCRYNWHSADSLRWLFPKLNYKYIFQIKYTVAFSSNSTRKLLRFEMKLEKCRLQFLKINIVLFIKYL